MTEFEKIALLYLAHQCELLDLSLAGQDALYRAHAGRARHKLVQDIRTVASEEILRLLGDVPMKQP